MRKKGEILKEFLLSRGDVCNYFFVTHTHMQLFKLNFIWQLENQHNDSQ